MSDFYLAIAYDSGGVRVVPLPDNLRHDHQSPSIGEDPRRPGTYYVIWRKPGVETRIQFDLTREKAEVLAVALSLNPDMSFDQIKGIVGG